MLLKQNVRTKVIILSLALGIVLSLFGYSYALFTISQEKSNTFHIVIGNLNYKIISDVLDSTMKVKVPSYTPLSFEVTMESLNPIDSKYQLYYEGTLPPGVTIRYVEGSGTPEGEIGVNGKTQKVTIVIENNSGSDYTATFGVQGGFTNQDFVLASNRTAITELFSLDKEYVYTGSYQTFTVPVSGYYRLEAWGAGSSGASSSAKGAYTSGLIYLEASELLYVYVGGQASTNINSTGDSNYGGWNGGGAGTVASGHWSGGAGNGATDFRLISGAWDFQDGLRSRILVAGGGGGLANQSSNVILSLNQNDGGGGSLISHYGQKVQKGEGYHCGNACSPGTYVEQNSGYAFGKGQDSILSSNSGSNGTGAGGGGYYGGYAGTNTSSSYAWLSPGGSGGNSFLSGYAGVNAVNRSGVHTNNTIHYSNKYFIQGKMESGIHVGNGKANVTFVSLEKPQKKTTKLNQVRYIRDCTTGKLNWAEEVVHWTELQAIKDGINVAKGKVITATSPAYGAGAGTGQDNLPYTSLLDGIINLIWATASDTGYQCITVDLGATYDLDEIAVWHYATPAKKFYTTPLLSVSTDQKNWTNLVERIVPEKDTGVRVNAWEEILFPSDLIPIGKTYDFPTSSKMYHFIVPESGVYKIEAWGSKGKDSGSGIGGYGGYTMGNIYLEKDFELYLYAWDYNGSSGGSADVRLVAGGYRDMESLKSRILVAGGGGAATDYSNGARGGAGGGLTGGSGSQAGSNPSCPLTPSTGGSQTSGGKGGISGNLSSSSCGGANGTNGGFGSVVGSGGDGYYSGGSGGWTSSFVNAAAGGSSYISGFDETVAIDRDGTIAPGALMHYSGVFFSQSRGVIQQGIWNGTSKLKITLISK